MGNHRFNVQPGLDHDGHFIPGFIHFAAVNPLDRQSVKDHEVPVNRGFGWQNSQQGNFGAVAHIGQHRPQCVCVTGHFHAHIKPFFHAELFLGVCDGLMPDVQGKGRAHLFGQIQAIGIDIGDHNIPGTGMPCNGSSHAPNGTGTGNQHVFAQHIKGEGRVGRIAQRVKAGENIGGNIRIAMPDIGDRNRQIFGKGTGSVHPDAAGIHAEMPPAGQAVPAMTANQMPLAGNNIAYLRVVNIAADFSHFSHKLVAHVHRNRDCFLSPGIPIVNVDIRSANGRFMNLDQDIVDADLRNRHLFQPDTRLRSGFYQGFHLHGIGPFVGNTLTFY